jgi:hypothetical protein
VSVGDPGPYIQMDGPLVWVPRTVPYLEARRIAQDANQNDHRLVYRGKEDADLLGFAQSCFCEEVCSRQTRCDETTDWAEVETGDLTCRVPAWKFELVER